MKVLVIGSTGGSGRAAVDELLARGHEVTAFARQPGSVATTSATLRIAQGDVLVLGDVERAVVGQDAVVVRSASARTRSASASGEVLLLP